MIHPSQILLKWLHLSATMSKHKGWPNQTHVYTCANYMNQAESRHPLLIPEGTRNFEWSRWPYFCFGRPKTSFGDGWLTSSCYHHVIMLAFHWPRAGVLFMLCTYLANSVHWSLDNHKLLFGEPNSKIWLSKGTNRKEILGTLICWIEAAFCVEYKYCNFHFMITLQF